MILLNYLHYLLLAIILGFLVTLFAKIMSEHKNFFTSLKVFYLALRVVFIFPITTFKLARKYRTELLQILNKDKTLNEKQKKNIRKVISSDIGLFRVLILFSFLNFREILAAFIDVSSLYVETQEDKDLINKSTIFDLSLATYRIIEDKLISIMKFKRKTLIFQ